VDKAFRIAFEATYRKTEYKEPTNLPNKGFGFHTQFQWAFDSGYLVGTRERDGRAAFQPRTCPERTRRYVRGWRRRKPNPTIRCS
jgi:hypothetical protein